MGVGVGVPAGVGVGVATGVGVGVAAGVGVGVGVAAELYSSALAREPLVLLYPAATSTLPLGSNVAV